MGSACKRESTKRKQMTAALLCAEGSCPTPKIMGLQVRFFFFSIAYHDMRTKKGSMTKNLQVRQYMSMFHALIPKYLHL